MKKLATFSTFLLLIVGLMAQPGSSLLDFSGKVITESKKDNKVLIKLYEGNKVVSKYQTKRNGKFIMNLERNKKYTLEFAQTDYITKRIMIDTKVNPKEAASAKEFKFDVSLIKAEKGINYSSLDFPIALIEFEQVLGQFNYNKAYTERMLEEQERLVNQNLHIASVE